MADEALRDLNSGTAVAPAAGDYFYLQRTSAGTRGQSTTFELMGGLEVDTTYDTAADHSDISAAAGKFYLVDLSAVTTNNLVFTLPVAASVNTGERVGVHITVTDADFELDLKSGAASDLINGTDHSSTAWSNIWIKGETVVFRCIDGSTADWIVEYDGRIPVVARIDQRTAQSMAVGVDPIEHDTVAFDNSGGAAVSSGSGVSGTIDVRRTGRYVISHRHSTAALSATDKFIQSRVNIDATVSEIGVMFAVGANKPLVHQIVEYELTAGEQLKHDGHHDSASAVNVNNTASTYPRLILREIL